MKSEEDALVPRVASRSLVGSRPFDKREVLLMLLKFFVWKCTQPPFR